MSAKALSKFTRADEWADRIGAQMGKSVEAIIEVGRLLVKAKADLAHGEWGRLFTDELVPFSINTAQRLMAVSQHPQISNTAHGQHLPPSWRSLYELTKVEPTRLTAAFKDGIITPDMKRSDVKALMPATMRRPQTHHASQAATSSQADDAGRTPVSRLYLRVTVMLSDELDTLSLEDQHEVLCLLEQMIAERKAAAA